MIAPRRPEVPAPLNPSTRLLPGPGPSDVHPRILAALSMPLLGHLDPEFVTPIEETQNLLRYVLQTALIELRGSPSDIEAWAIWHGLLGPQRIAWVFERLDDEKFSMAGLLIGAILGGAEGNQGHIVLPLENFLQSPCWR